MPASTNESTTAGPAFCAATVPVSTKMPVPMIAPMPSAVRFTAPSTRLRLWSVSASTCRSVTLFRRNKFMRDVGFDLLNEASLVSQAALLTLSALISQYFMEFGAMALMSTLVSFELPIRVREGRQLLSSMHNQSIQCRRALPLQRKIVARCDPYLRYSLNPSSVAE